MGGPSERRKRYLLYIIDNDNVLHLEYDSTITRGLVNRKRQKFSIV